MSDSKMWAAKAGTACCHSSVNSVGLFHLFKLLGYLTPLQDWRVRPARRSGSNLITKVLHLA
ncbi:hypothetical protein, partial [Agrobacterium vitis]|uniref:hypothetical protein n=1 Tax=Agrobacterium vitis TaxID=373 RepID=UPI001AEE2042